MIGPLASLIVKTASGPKKPAKSATTFVSNKGDSPSPAMSAKKPTVKKTVVSSEKLLNLKPLERRQQQLSKEKSNTGTPLDSSFNTINESLTNILSIISNTNTFKKEKVKDNQRVEKKQRKKIREAMLEGAGRARVAALSKLKGVSKPAFLDTIGNYFKNLLIGSLVLFVMNQYERIKKFVEDTFKNIKELFENLKPILTPVWDSLKWIVGEGVKLIAPLIGFDPKTLEFDKNKLDENLSKLDKAISTVFNMFDLVGSFFGILQTSPAQAMTEKVSPPPQTEEVSQQPTPTPAPPPATSPAPSTAPSTAPPTVSPPAPPSAGAYTPEDYRVAAALATEAGRGQSAVDVLQVAQNRVAYPGYGNNLTEVFGAPNQFEGVFKRSIPQFFKIQTAEDAAKFVGTSVSVIEGYLSDMMNQSYQRAAAKFVGGALEFRGSPSLVRRVNSDSDPKNDIQADSRGIIPGSVWRGGAGDNQFLVSPEHGDKLLRGGPAKFNVSSISRSASYDRQYMAASVIVPLPQQQQVAQAQQGDTQVIPIFPSVNNDYGELFGNSLYKV